MKLTERRQKFVTEYQLCGNATQAAQRAGFGAAGSRVTAHRLLTNANVRAALADLQRDAANEASLTRQDAISGLQAAIALAQQQGNPAAMIAGWREIGRMLGFYEPSTCRIESTDRMVELMAKFEAMSDDELLQITSTTHIIL